MYHNVSIPDAIKDIVTTGFLPRATWMPELARLALLNAVLFGLGLITFALFLASAKRSSGFLKYSGLFQRLNLLLLYAVLLINLPALVAGP